MAFALPCSCLITGICALTAEPSRRSLPIGAELTAGGAHFRVYAPGHDHVAVVCEGEPPVALTRERDGYFSGVTTAHAGTRYRYQLGADAFPDPASRSQPEGPHGPSQVIDHDFAMARSSVARSATLLGQVIYEVHVGTFTSEGTFCRRAGEKLSGLREASVSPVSSSCPSLSFPATSAGVTMACNGLHRITATVRPMI